MSTTELTLSDAFKNRGSLHLLSDDVDVSDERVREIVREAILHSPSAFNCQSSRAVILFGEQHRKFWDLARDASKASLPLEIFETSFQPRIKMFRAAYGTILFYESQKAIDKALEKVPFVKDKMPQWSEHASGMLQYNVWTSLCAQGFGVNLQHFSPFVDGPAAKEWQIPADWSLKAQMVFGKPAGPRIKEKDFEPVEDRMKVFGAKS